MLAVGEINSDGKFFTAAITGPRFSARRILQQRRLSQDPAIFAEVKKNF